MLLQPTLCRKPWAITLEFVGKSILNWGHERNVHLGQIDPGKPDQKAYIEVFNARLKDERLNGHWFNSLDHVRGVIET
jgi:putative transposase